ncbi:MAG: hypothetical protein EHM41_18530 [Chloroflexi bacterium]|nr:MAG: hypothetical protein EHM41_18530 [Chloroflexota bacterium]
MSGLESLDILFVIWAFLFQIILIVHFSLRKWYFHIAMRYGPLVYALSIPAAAVSIILLLNDKAWSFWIGGFIYLIWGIFGYWVEFVMKIQWRNPPRWSIFIPYIFLYLATIMFYWWPLALISRPLWNVYAVLFVVCTALNVTSHKQAEDMSGWVNS